eukprot:scaffold44201_cov80-Cyclotella_meneghiniana.AAC.2
MMISVAACSIVMAAWCVNIRMSCQFRTGGSTSLGALGYGSIATIMKCKMQSEWLETTATLAHATILSSFRQYQGYGRCQDLKIDDASEFENSWADANDGRSES